jgi:hypothetical protein
MATGSNPNCDRIPFLFVIVNILHIIIIIIIIGKNLLSKSLDGSVGIAASSWDGRSGSRNRFPAGAGNFSLHHRAQPPIQWVSGALYLRVKRSGREADHSSPFSAEVKE